jgi:hypothetical protein
MRLLDLKLTEAALSAGELTKYFDSATEPTKWKRLNIFLHKVLEKEPFELVDGTSTVVAQSEYNKIIDTFNAGIVPSNFKIATDKGDLSLSKFFKSAELGGKGAGGAGLSNKGEVSEGILGASLFAKLIARTRGKIDIISSKEIWEVIDMLAQTQEDHYGVTVKDGAKKTVNDSIQYTLKLKPGPYADLMDEAKRSLLVDVVNSAVAYANSADSQSYCEYFYLNGKPDVIHVITDGISGATTKKSDVEVVITDPKTGKQTHQQLNISLKAGSDQMGQIGQGKEGFEFDSQKELWNAFGIDIESSRKEFNKELEKHGLIAAIETIYRDATTFLQDLLSGGFDDAEYLFLRDLVKGIDYFATLNDPTVILVSLERGTYEVMSFANLERQLKGVDLDARYSETSATPQVEIFDKNSGQQLFRIRTKRETKKGGGIYVRNYIEKGPLLKQLTSIKK